ANEYIVTKVGFGPGTEFASPPEAVTFDPTYVEVANLASIEYVNVLHRWERIAAIYDALSLFPLPVGSALAAHRNAMAKGEPIDASLVRIVSRLCEALAAYDMSYSSEFDPLPV